MRLMITTGILPEATWVTLQSCVQRLHVFSNLYNIIYALHTRKTVIVTDL